MRQVKGWAARPVSASACRAAGWADSLQSGPHMMAQQGLGAWGGVQARDIPQWGVDEGSDCRGWQDLHSPERVEMKRKAQQQVQHAVVTCQALADKVAELNNCEVWDV